MLVGVFVANIVLIDVLGWVISGAILFYGSALALGSRHYLRALVISVAMSLITFYGFAIGLGVGLPAGILNVINGDKAAVDAILMDRATCEAVRRHGDRPYSGKPAVVMTTRLIPGPPDGPS